MESVAYLAVGSFVGVAIAAIVYKLLIKSGKQESDEQLLKTLELRLQMMMPELINNSSETLIKLANEKLGAEKGEIKTDLENKRAEMHRMMQQIERYLKENEAKLEASDRDRIGTFNTLKQKLEDQQLLTEQLRVSTENLKQVLSNNQMRGQFGEQVAEDLLKMAGFTKGVDYLFNKQQEKVETRPDFTILLPDQTRINVDAKFPYSNLQKMTEAESPQQKEQYEKSFEQDVKQKISQVTKRQYINPEERTVDFVILFIPNEMIFSYIYDKMNDVWTNAMQNKVILAGPFSFTAILRMIRQAYDNFEIKGNIREIIGHVQAFAIEFGVFEKEFNKFGERISQLDKQYHTVSSTRMNVLRKKMDKVKMLEDSDEIDTQVALPEKLRLVD